MVSTVVIKDMFIKVLNKWTLFVSYLIKLDTVYFHYRLKKYKGIFRHALLNKIIFSTETSQHAESLQKKKKKGTLNEDVGVKAI